MPIYEYRCESCDHQFEKLMRVGAEAPVCPSCGRDTRKLVSTSSFVLKGSGWYRDHYGLKKGGGTSSSGDSAGSGSTSPGSSTTKAA